MGNIYISNRANKLLTEYLNNQGHKIISVGNCDTVYREVSTHPDIYMCKLGSSPCSPVFAGDKTKLGYRYPENIKFNAACTGRFFIHNLKYTSPELLKKAEDMNMIMIDVKQGYAKCNIVIVDETSIITSDVGIAKSCEKYPLDVLLISPGHVTLPGFDCGFLGGASGRVDSEIIFNGDLSKHPDFQKICGFIEKRGLGIKWFFPYELEDIGSVIQDNLQQMW